MSKFRAGDLVRFLKNDYDEDHFEIGEILTVADRKGFVSDSFYSTKDGATYINDHQVELVGEPEKSNVPKKYNDNKPMMSLIRPEFTKGLADVLTFGFKKYQEKVGESSNYLKGDGMYYTDLYDSLQRHLTSWISGDSIDEESGKNHLLHAAANIMFLYTYEVTKKGKDNRETLYGKHNKS